MVEAYFQKSLKKSQWNNFNEAKDRKREWSSVREGGKQEKSWSTSIKNWHRNQCIIIIITIKWWNFRFGICYHSFGQSLYSCQSIAIQIINTAHSTHTYTVDVYVHVNACPMHRANWGNQIRTHTLKNQSIKFHLMHPIPSVPTIHHCDTMQFYSIHLELVPIATHRDMQTMILFNGIHRNEYNSYWMPDLAAGAAAMYSACNHVIQSARSYFIL